MSIEDEIDLIALNREPKLGVNSIDGIRNHFKTEPNGQTSLYSKLNEVLTSHVDETKKVIVIATDGVPNDRSLRDFRSLVRNRAGKKPSEVPIVFQICSDVDEDTAYLNELDSAPCVGVFDLFSAVSLRWCLGCGLLFIFGCAFSSFLQVVDDYASEKNEIEDPDKRRQCFSGCTRGDYHHELDSRN